MTLLKAKFIENYLPLLETFIAQIESFNIEMIPEPHLPVFGKGYENAHNKVLFMGWETRGSKGLKEFFNTAKTNPEKALFWWEDDFDELSFVYWRSNLSRDFWSFNLRLLAKLNGIPNWKELYKNPFVYEDMLSSIAWANTDSIERYHVTAQSNGVTFEDWQRVKDASKIFDRPPLVFNTLNPNLVILMNWGQDETQLFKKMEIEYELKMRPDYLWYYKFKKPDMHLFWTKHPFRLHFEGVDYNVLVDEIVSTYNSHKIK